MTDKLVKIDYSQVSANVSTPNLSADANQQDAYLTSVVIPQVNILPETYATNLLVQVTGVDESSVPTPEKFRRNLDLVTLLESPLVKATQKGLLETIRLSFREDLVFIATYSRQLLSASTIADLISKRSQLTKTESIASSTTLVNRVLLNKPEQSVFSDQKTLVFNKYATPHIAEFTEFAYSDILLTKLELATALQEFSRIADYVRSFEDYVDITDDYYGLSNIDDDQTAHFNKVSFSLTGAADLSAWTAQKLVPETANTQLERFAYAASLTKLEPVTLVQTPTLRVRKNPRDTVAKQDASEKYVTKPLPVSAVVASQTRYSSTILPVYADDTYSSVTIQFDSRPELQTIYSSFDVPSVYVDTVLFPSVTGSYETLAIAILTDLQTTSSVYELHSTLIGPEYITGIASTTVISNVVDYIRDFADIVIATDDYYGLANIDDDQTAAFDKNVVNLVYTGDAQSYAADLYKVSTLLAQDQHGALSNTVYSSATYTLSTSSITAETSQQDYYAVADLANWLAENSYSHAVLSSTLAEFETIKTLEHTATTQDLGINYTALLKKFSVTIPQEQATLVTQAVKSEQVLAATLHDVLVNKPADDIVSTTTGLTYTDLILQLAEASLQDVINFLKFIDYPITSQITASDSGFANNQNYFAEAYVEPGYVGTNTYFS